MIRLIALAMALVFAPPASAQQAAAPVASATPAAKKPPVSRAPAAARAASATKPAASARSGPCVGVIPRIGESFVVQRVGLTVFGNAYKEFPIDPWGLDDLVVARVRAALGAGFTVRRLAVAKSDFDVLKEPGLFRNRSAELAGVIRKIAGSAGCGHYLLVEKLGGAFMNTNQTVGGIGILNYGFPGLEKTYLFALFHMRLFDGKTFETLRREAGDFVDVTPIRGPSRVLDNYTWPEDPAQAITPAMRDATRALLTKSLDKTLPKVLEQ